MRLTTFEKITPWTGAVAGAAWIAQDLFAKSDTTDDPGRGDAGVINSHLTSNIAGLASLIVMGIMLVFFAAAVRNLLRSAEAREATYSVVAYGGWLLVAAGVSQMAMWRNGMFAAADDHAQDAVHALSYVQYFGWAGMTIGLATAFLAIGLGGLRNAVLPKWFSVTTVILGVLGALGAAHIPPGGLVNYIALPFWLVAASVIIARNQRKVSAVTQSVPTTV